MEKQTSATKSNVNNETTDNKVKTYEQKIHEDEQKKLNSMYIFDCVGKMYGCDTKTNGTQYCCKFYCPHELEKETLN
tara:strand:- start:5927 stop:6157 length:231 start_codon:yes stop_codon:yes gene_type:complete